MPSRVIVNDIKQFIIVITIQQLKDLLAIYSVIEVNDMAHGPFKNSLKLF